MVEIQRITMDDPLYKLECELRERVLLEPIGLSMRTLGELFPGAEESFEHFVAVTRSAAGVPRVVGCATLLADHPSAGVGKLMQMAVDAQRQGEGIGRRLVIELESRALGDLGLVELYCHAREDASAFYGSLGWREEGERFEEAGIPHVKMVMRPPAS